MERATSFELDSSGCPVGYVTGYRLFCCSNRSKYEKHPRRDSLEESINHRGVIYINLDNVRKMIGRFLDEKGMSKEELASSLDTTVKGLDRILCDELPEESLLARINLALVKLYCSTPW